jgi:hypothetical protein
MQKFAQSDRRGGAKCLERIGHENSVLGDKRYNIHHCGEPGKHQKRSTELFAAV